MKIEKEVYLKAIKKSFWQTRTRNLFIQQVDNYFLASEHCDTISYKYKLGDYVQLKRNYIMRGEGGNRVVDDVQLNFIAENGFISPDFVQGYDKNKRQKTPFTVPVWNIKNDILLKDYILKYSGATLKCVSRDGVEKTQLISYNKIDETIHNLRNEDFWLWQCEQTKEIRYMPSLIRDKVQLAFIMNMENCFGQNLLKNDVFNKQIDKNLLKTFLPKWFINNYIYGMRDDFTTNRESAILFGIPNCFIEGILVGRYIEKNVSILSQLKLTFPQCYICNLDGIVIM